MKSLTAFAFITLFFFMGCSTTTTNSVVQSADQVAAEPINTVVPGNGIGNYMVMPEPWVTNGRETRIASADVRTGNTASAAATDEPFEPLLDGRSANQWEAAEGAVASTQDITGIQQDTESALQPSPFEPEETEIVETEPQPEPEVEYEVVSNQPEDEEPVYTPPTSQVTTAQVYGAAENLDGLDTWTVVPLAHFNRGLRHVVVAWPAIDSSGRSVDATVVGICLEEDSQGNLEQCGRRWVINNVSASTAALESALGGADYEVLSNRNGVDLDNLGPRVTELGNGYVNAAARGDRATARRTAMELAQLLPLQDVAFDNGLANLLWTAARYEGRLEHVSTTMNGDAATLTFRARRGFITLRTIHATAEEVDNSGRWILAAYR